MSPVKRPPSPDRRSPPKRPKASSPASVATDPIGVYVVQAKLDAQAIADIFALIEDSANGTPAFKLCTDVHTAKVVVTAIRMRRRLERHLAWGLAKQKAVVTPQWLFDSVREHTALPCGDYAALHELHDTTTERCPDCHDSGSEHEEADPQAKHDDSEEKPTRPEGHARPPTPPASPSAQSGLPHTARYACSRASPLVCPNPGLISELEVLRRSRELEGKDINALSYERAIAIIKSFPRAITLDNFRSEVVKLPNLGGKTLSKIEEYLTTGKIPESQSIRSSERFKTLVAFTTIHGIGPTTARKLFALGMRTFDELERYYDVDTDALVRAAGSVDPVLPDLSIKVGLALRNDFAQTIPRAEVEAMHDVVMSELARLQPGCMSTIVGGYRRGKPASNDVDIVITHPDAGAARGLRHKLVKRLHDCGMVTHVMHLSSFRSIDALHTVPKGGVETVLTVFALPGPEPRVRRRLDLIFASPAAYYTAIVGWTGSKMFERDLRSWAKHERGYKFDSSGITRRYDSKVLVPRSEREVFEMLGLPWMEPTLRNADA